MKTTDIKGKKYIEVNERLKHFRANYKGYSLLSELVSLEAGVVVFKATVLDNNRNEVATGFAYEKEGSSFINKTSYIENCETSAWGRALGNFGIGIDTSVASADEVGNAIANQNITTKVKNAYANQNEKFKAELKKAGINVDNFYKCFDISEKNILTILQHKEMLVSKFAILEDIGIKDVREFLDETSIKMTDRKMDEETLKKNAGIYIDMKTSEETRKNRKYQDEIDIQNVANKE